MAWFFRRKRAVTATIAAPTEKQFETIGGRRHMVDAPYVLPTDDGEVNRLDFQHYMLRYALKGNYAAPLAAPQSILDVGAGTGRWALEMANIFPDANVVASDLVTPKIDANPASGGIETRPGNYCFVEGNVLDGLPFPDNSFDFVHMRLLLFAIPAERWPGVVRELVRVTKPGGWVESVETGAQQQGGPAMDLLVEWITLASMRRGIDPSLGPRVGDLMRDAGLVDVRTRHEALPVGRYGGRLGNMAEIDVFGVVGAVKPLVVAQGITHETDYDAAIAQARKDLDQHQCRLPFYLACGQKPQ